MINEILSAPIVKECGAIALMFYAFYLVLQFNKSSIEALIKQQSDFMNKIFELYNKLIESTVWNSSMLQKIHDGIISNQWCPYIKRVQKQETKEEVKQND